MKKAQHKKKQFKKEQHEIEDHEKKSIIKIHYKNEKQKTDGLLTELYTLMSLSQITVNTD